MLFFEMKKKKFSILFLRSLPLPKCGRMSAGVRVGQSLGVPVDVGYFLKLDPSKCCPYTKHQVRGEGKEKKEWRKGEKKKKEGGGNKQKEKERRGKNRCGAHTHTTPTLLVLSPMHSKHTSELYYLVFQLAYNVNCTFMTFVL
jgi:hypothetical protein